MHMKRANVASLVVVLLFLAVVQLSSFSSANYFPYPGPDLPHIYIKSDGTIEPVTAPIEKTGNIYKLTDDISLHTVEIQRDNIVLNGAGYTIQGNASWMGYDAGNNGIIISGRKNVNVTCLTFEGCYAGIRVISSSGVGIAGNSFSSSNSKGVVLQDSTLCIVENNTLTNLHTDLNAPAIMINGTSNIVRNNTLTGSTYGIKIMGSSNKILANKFESILPIQLDRAQSNVVAENTISGLANQKGNEGIALFADCSNNLIFNNRVTGFINNGIRFVFNAENNMVYNNYFRDNGFAVVIQERAVNNRFYGNTFAVDSCNVSISEIQSTFWDNGTIGNYWGKYAGADSNGDGIGDSPYKLYGYMWGKKEGGFIEAPAGQDNYPLMAPYDNENGAVALPQSSPLLVIFAVFSVAVVTCASLLVYLRKRKHAAV
ncbi:MAG: nitrous oxide reductase family maturation protein NosD [Candidatus Bathyarchaeia archaeon]